MRSLLAASLLAQSLCDYCHHYLWQKVDLEFADRKMLFIVQISLNKTG